MTWAYPPYPFKRRERALAYDDGINLVAIEGWDADRKRPIPLKQLRELPSASYDEWVKSATENHLDVRVGKVQWFRYLDESIRDERAYVSAIDNSADSGPRMVRVDWRVGRCGRATLCGADAWGGGIDAESLRTTRMACDLLGTGTYPTPAALGTATLYQALGDRATAARARLRALPVACADDVREALVGLRAEVFAPRGSFFRVATEIDRSSAYVTECLEPVPCGRVRPFYDESEIGESEWYFASCVVSIYDDLPLGPFPLRDASSGTLTWPTRRGIYQGVPLTCGEIRDSRSAGAHVQPVSGWAWETMQPILRPWAEAMLAARARASIPAARSMIKLAGNATVGRFAMSGTPLRVSAASPAGDPIVTDGLLTAYTAVADPRHSVVTMPHWALFVWSEARRHLYHRQLAEMEDGNDVILSNADSLILSRRSDRDDDGWRERTLSNLVIVDNRSYVCDQKAILPGRTGEMRESIIEWAQEYAYGKEQWRKDHPLETYLQNKRWKQNGHSQLASLSARSWPSYGDHCADLADVVLPATYADSYAAGG